MAFSSSSSSSLSLLFFVSFLFFSSFFFISFVSSEEDTSATYKYYCTGNCGTDAVVPTSPGVVLMGGGADVDNAFVWMIGKSEGGDFVVIRTDDDDLYDKYIYNLGPLNSVATIVILNRNGSSDPFVVQKVTDAEAIFFAGGDQFTYYQNWKDTPMGVAIQEAIQDRQIPIGGTSAGEESLGEFMFTAEFDSVESKASLNNPYNSGITIGTDFFSVPMLESVICDAHFFQRDRMGRLVTWVGRLINDVWSPNAAMGIGVDEETAILLDLTTGIADITSWENAGCAYFLRSYHAPGTCEPGSGLTFRNVETFKACGNTSDIFDFNTWTPNTSAGTSYFLSAKDGELSSSNGSIY